MPVTDYDTILSGGSTAPAMQRNAYDDLIDGRVDQANQQAVQSIALAAGNNPDAAAEAQRLGAQTGVGAGIAGRNLPAMRQRAAVLDAQSRMLGSSSPILAQQLADPNFAAISHDQLDNLSTSEKIFGAVKDAVGGAGDLLKTAFPVYGFGARPEPMPMPSEIYDQYNSGHAQYELGMLGIKAKRGQASTQDWQRIRQLQAQIASAPQPQTVTGRTLGGVASMAGNLLPMVPNALTVGAGTGAAAGVAALAGVVSAPASPATALAGFGAGFESEFGAQNYEMMAGNTYLDLLDKGVDEHRAQVAAGVVGAVNTALQMGALRVAGKPLAGMADEATARLFNRAMGEQVAEQMTRPTVGRAAANFVTNWAKNTAIGTGEMAAQTLTSALGEDWARRQDVFTPELGQKLGSAFGDALLTMGTLNAMTGMVGFSWDTARAQKAQASAEFFQALSQNAADSKVRTRNPDAYEKFVAAQAAGSPAENVYVDGDKFAQVLHQSGIEPEQLERTVPGITDQINEASLTGGDVMMPTAQYAARLAGTDLGKALLPHMRLDPDAMSAEESTRFLQAQKERFEEARASAEQQMATNDTFAKSAKAVEGDIFDQLKATKTMPDDAARTNAQFVRDFVVTQAARAGMLPEEFYNRYKYTVAGVAPEGDKLAQMPFDEGVAAPAAGADLLHQTTRGGFDPATLTTLLGQKADMSTFLHETSHYFLSVYGDLAKQPDAPPEVKADMDALLKWFGVKDLDAWHAMSLDEQRKYHEQFAYNFEKYLADGKAPSIETQPLFDRFAAWLKRTYVSIRDDVNTIYKREHGTDLPIMTGEVRDVMGRMLASDEQARQAEAVRGMQPLFRSAEEAKMTPEEWAAYRQMNGEATDEASAQLSRGSIRQMQWLSNARSRVLKELQRQHDTLRKGVREEVAGEVQEEPVYAAQRFLKTGELKGEDGEEIQALMGHKLDSERVKALFPESAPGEKPDLGKLRGMTMKDGLDPDIVAPMFGYDNGEQLVRSIADANALKDEIDARTDQRMLERHGEMASPEQREAAVEKALHNEARQRFVAVELRHLTKAVEPVRVMMKAAELTAEKMITEKPIADVVPREFSAAEARAAREAVDAMRRGDSAAAAKAKRNQLLQNALAKEAIRVREETDAALRYLNKFDRPSRAVTKAIGADYMDRINELLAGYALSARARYGDSSQTLSAWVQAEYARTGVMPAVSDDVVARMGSMHWKDMTIDQMRDLRDAVKSLEYVGKRQNRIELEGNAHTVDELIDQVRANLIDVKHTEPVDVRNDLKHARGLDKIHAQWLNAKGMLRSADAALLKMEQFFQWLDAGKDAGLKEAPVDGPMQRLFHLASNAEGRERAMRAESTAALRTLGDKLRDAKVDLNQRLDVPELPLPGGMTWYRENLLAMALNMGNESNKEKLLKGYFWQERDAVAAINRLLSPPEMDFVQGVWDHIGSYGNEIVELQRRQTGVTPKMIRPSPLSTAHGTYYGGYYPIVYDGFQDRTIEEKQARSADQLFENNYARPSTNKGHTIERTHYNGPVWLSLGVIARHIDQVTHDLAWREPITDMNKVLTDPRLLDEVDHTYGREYSKQFRPWLQSMANDRVFNTAGDSAWENFIRKTRSNATMVGIGFRLSTMAVHGTSALSNSIGEIGPGWFSKGVQQFMGVDRVQQARDFIYARSPEMAHRLDEADRNVHEAIDDINQHQAALVSPTAATRLYDNARKFAFRGVMTLDLMSAMPTWMGAYLKGMAKEADGGLNLSEADAVEYANRAVRNAHGGGGVKDMAAVQRDKGIMSLATMFYSYWNHVYNRQRDIGKGIAAAPGGTTRDFSRVLARSLFYVAVPQIAHILLKPSPQEKEQDNTLEGFLKTTAEDIGLGLVSGVPILRDLATAAVRGRDYAFTPIEQAGNTFVHTAEDAMKIAHGEEPSKRFSQNAAEAAGYALGLPLSQPAATAKFLWDVTDGEADPESLKDWWRGIMTGKIR